MLNSDYFDSNYVDGSNKTNSPKQKSDIKSFLKEPLQSAEFNKYGTSKPKRVVIKAKITNG